MFLGNTKQR